MRCFIFPQFGDSVHIPPFPSKQSNYCLVWGFLCEVNEKCYFLGCYGANNGDSLPKFRDSLWVLSSRRDSGLLKMRRTSCSETSVRNFQYSLRMSPEVRSSNHTSVGDLRLCRLCWRRFDCSEIEGSVNRQRFIGVTKKVGVLCFGRQAVRGRKWSWNWTKNKTEVQNDGFVNPNSTFLLFIGPCIIFIVE